METLDILEKCYTFLTKKYLNMLDIITKQEKLGPNLVKIEMRSFGIGCWITNIVPFPHPHVCFAVSK